MKQNTIVKPLFAPTIYEHAAKLIGKTPSQIAQNAELLARAQLAAASMYEPDLLSVGVDIYNVEAEALGASVRYYDDDRLPSLTEPLVYSENDVLSIPDPEKDGRMPLLLEACERIKKETNIPAGGTVTGPFTLAAILRGFENFIMDLLENPSFAQRQIRFAKEVGLAFARAYIKRGLRLVINESWIAPPLCSPSLYRAFAQPAETEMIAELKALGMKNVALICGGNTTPIAQNMLKAGSSLIMADWHCDFNYFLSLCREKDVSLRVNIRSSSVQDDNETEMREGLLRIRDECGDYEKLLVGCGIVTQTTSPEAVLRFKRLFQEILF